MRSGPQAGVAPLGVGVVVPHDMALDAELWRWVPEDVSLYLTRTPHDPRPVLLETVSAISDTAVVRAATRDVLSAAPGVCAYACASGSFVRGLTGERALVDAMLAAGAPEAVTTSGALLAGLELLGVGTVAVATPYHAGITAQLDAYLSEAGFALAGSAHLGLTAEIWRVPYDVTADLVRRADHPDAGAVFVSCTNLATYDLVVDLERELGKPVLTANQVTLWASLRLLGRRAVGAGQCLLEA